MRFDPAQDLASNIGKIVRINTDGTIPADNPFVVREGALGDIWSVGSRNALGAAINPVSDAPDGAVLLLTDGPDAELLRLTPRAGGRK